MLEYIINRLSQRYYEAQERYYKTQVSKNLDVYLPPNGSLTPNSAVSFDLMQKIHEFVQNPQLKSLLLIGDSGLGKTLLSFKLTNSYWQAQNSSTQRLPCIPLRIWVPSISAEQRQEKLLETYLSEQGGLTTEEINNLRTATQTQQCRLLIILDGLDEIPLVKQNMYLSNQWWSDWQDVKVIATCRPEGLSDYLDGLNYRTYFYPGEDMEAVEAFKEYFFRPFSDTDIRNYLQQYIQHCQQAEEYEVLPATPFPVGYNNLSPEKHYYWSNWEHYHVQINTLPGVSELASNPFVLSILADVLPFISQRNQESDVLHPIITRKRIYDHFVHHWLSRQATRIWQDREKRQQLSELKTKENLLACLNTYSTNLARLVLNRGEGSLDVVLEEAMTLIPALVHTSANESSYFQQDQIPPETMAIIRSGCLLESQGNTFHFLHKSIVEYYAAEALFQGIHAAADAYLNRLPLADVQAKFSLNAQLIKAPKVKEMLTDIVTTDASFKKLLYDTVDFSKKEPLVTTAAANAITILNLAGECFSGKNWEGVRIAGADLSNSVCDTTNFSDADLSNVRIEHAWFRNANLKGANLKDVEIVELPNINHSATITSFCIDSKGEWLFIADFNGYITQHELKSDKVLYQWKVSAYGGNVKLGSMVGFSPITALTVSHNGRWLAYGTFDGAIHLWSIKERRCVKQIVMPELATREFFTAYKVYKLSFSTNDNHIILQEDLPDSSSKSASSAIWDIQTDKLVQKLDGYFTIASDQGRFFACKNFRRDYGRDYSLRYSLNVYQFSTQRNKWSSMLSLNGRPIAFSPNEKFLAVENDDEQIQLINIATGRAIKKLENEMGLKVREGAFSYDGHLLACRSNRGISVWHVESGNHLYDLSLPSHISDGAGLPSVAPGFLPSLLRQKLYFFVGKVMYSWQLKELPYVNLRRTPIKNDLTFVPQGMHKSGQYHYAEDRHFTHGIQAQLTIENHTACTLTVTHSANDQSVFSFPSKGDSNHASEKISFLLSPNQRYFVFSYEDTYAFEMLKSIPPIAEGILKTITPLAKDTAIRIFDLKERQLKWTVSHHNQIITKQFSADSKWLVTAGYTVRIWDMTSGLCLQQYKDLTDWAYAVALSKDKNLLTIADGGRNLSLWDTTTQKLLCRIAEIPRNLKKLKFDIDTHYLIGEGNDNQYVFKLKEVDGNYQLELHSTSATLNFYCHGADIEASIDLSEDNVKLMHQRGTTGTPLQQLRRQEELKYRSPLKFFTADQPIIKKRIKSKIQPHLPLKYDFWTVSILRDNAAKENSYHTFLLVEGMDAFGCLVFRRYDLVTRFGDEKMPEGFAKIIIREDSGHIKQHEAKLKDIGTPRHLGKGVFSSQIVGHTWSLSRYDAEALHQAVLVDQNKGLIPYHQLGETSILVSRGSYSCYTWAREKLLSLSIENIRNDLPQQWKDYAGVDPKVHLTQPPNEPLERGSCLVM